MKIKQRNKLLLKIFLKYWWSNNRTNMYSQEVSINTKKYFILFYFINCISLANSLPNSLCCSCPCLFA